MRYGKMLPSTARPRIRDLAYPGAAPPFSFWSWCAHPRQLGASLEDPAPVTVPVNMLMTADYRIKIPHPLLRRRTGAHSDTEETATCSRSLAVATSVLPALGSPEVT